MLHLSQLEYFPPHNNLFIRHSKMAIPVRVVNLTTGVVYEVENILVDPYILHCLVYAHLTCYYDHTKVVGVSLDVIVDVLASKDAGVLGLDEIVGVQIGEDCNEVGSTLL